MATFNLSLLSRSCWLALVTTGGFSGAAIADSPWRVTDGSTLDVTNGYTSTTARDYPLFSSGNGSLLQTTIAGLDFRTVGNLLYAANAAAGGSIQLNGAILATNGTLAHGANIDAGELAMNGGSISVMGANSSGVFGSNGAILSLNNLGIAADGAGSSGITLTSGELSLSNSTIVATGANNRVISLAYSTAGQINATLENVNIFLRGEGTQAALGLGNGQVTGNAVNISTSGQNRGVEIYNSSGGHGSLTLNNSNISTQNGDGVYILDGDVTLNNTTVNTVGGVAVNINKTAQATLRGGSFTTQGAHADALWIATADSSADVAGATFTTQGAGSHAFNAQYGLASLIDSNLATSGDGSYGLYSESEVQANNVNITTQGSSGIGVFAARGGVINLNHATVNTAGNAGAGLLAYPGSTINGNGLVVQTQGEDGHALWARAGVLNISDSRLAAQGKNAAGLYVSSPPTGDGSRVTLNNVLMSSEAGPAIKTNGAALDVALKNGTQVTGGNGVLLENLAGNLSDPNYNGDVSLTAGNRVVLTGDIRAATENQVNVALSNTSRLTGAIMNVDALRLDTGSQWVMTGNSNLDRLTNEGSVAFSHDGASFSTLSLGSLTGNGAFSMNTDIASLNGDLIAVAGTASGNHLLSIKNTGREPGRTEDALTIVTTGGGDGQFALNGGAVDAGTYQYELQQRGKDWVLAQKFSDPGNGGDGGDSGGGDSGGGTPVPTPTTLTALGLFNATPTAWYGELTTLRTRMGDVRQGNQQGGAWVRTSGSQYDVNDRAGVGYRQRQSGMSVGVDSAHALTNGQLLTGIFSGISRSKLDFKSGSSGTINSFFIGGYGTWLLESGWFADAVAKANNFNSHADARMTDGEKARGGYSVPALGLSVEVGRQLPLADGWFVEPSAQLSTLWVKGQSYTFSNELHANSGSVTSHQAALNGVVGKTLALENGVALQPWLRSSVIQELSDNNSVSINGNKFNNDLSGTRGEFGAGISAQVTKDLQIYADARYAKGDKIKSPWGGNLGVRWMW
ncbi:autotransporter outer membrane beta-barrel domain-containing protein [Serratia marcescens]|uniref:autotransporter outer membrane beta-barrel domain-containing protein n=1 Tax=Serratia marcescens TaxID=615 RepID=UPI000F7F2D06|nr:autotransporter outer membrane beta-barrel domain-containing protein [Serratia marcescens]RTF43318.1 autotransporter outer membrane beta-barrel domain-containing protein [Serratia marcescens]